MEENSENSSPKEEENIVELPQSQETQPVVNNQGEEQIQQVSQQPVQEYQQPYQQTYQQPYPGYQQHMPYPPEAKSIMDLVRITGIISLIFGIILLISGIATLLFFVGIVPLIFGIFDLVIWMKCKEINGLMEQRRYGDARDKTLLWMILGFIFGGLLPGILLLVAFLKFDPLLRATQPPQPPQQPPQALPPPPS